MSIQLATNINNVIVTNPQAFTINNIISQQQWYAMFNTTFNIPATITTRRDEFAYINSYVAVNKILRKRGFKVKAQNYYSGYKVTGLDSARREVSVMVKRGQATLQAAYELQANIPNTTRRYRFRSLRTAEIQSVGRYVATPLVFR